MDKKNVTIADIAQDLGISKTTVSRSISGKGRIGDATRERVLQYIAEHDYKPNMIAKSLANSCTYNIGVIMPENYCMSDAAFFVNCLSGVHAAAAARGYDVLLTVCDNIDLENLERMVARRKVDGVVVMRTFVEDHAIPLLIKKQMPFVVAGSSTIEHVIQIDHKNEEACKKLTELLLSQNLERIALIGSNMHEVVSQKRYQGFLAAHASMGRQVRKELVYTDSTGTVGDAVENILKIGADGVICMDDHICLETLGYLKKADCLIPDQIKVASFFDSPLLENYVPSITTISFDVYKLGLVSGNTLIDVIEKKEVCRRTFVGYQIMRRGSA